MNKLDLLYTGLLSGGVNAERLLRDEPMARHTTFKLGGPADIMLRAASGDEIISALNAAAELGVPCMVMGNGSDLLVRDGGIDGLVIQVGDCMNNIEFDGCAATVQAGSLMSRVASECVKRSLAGMEALGGIPGTLGGASAMNAGAYGSELKDVLVSLNAIQDGRMVTYKCDELALGYRTSRVQTDDLIVTELHLSFVPGEQAEIRARADDFAQRRREKQPLSYPSAGSTFKRPEGHFAGALIQQCGLKGARVGGAQVSGLHAGFVINAGGATAADVLELIELIQTKVLSETGVQLEPEVKIIGRD